MSAAPEGSSRLRDVLEAACAEAQCSRNALTVLAKHNDPYRTDTGGGREFARWVARQIDELFGPLRRVHIRGLHYACVAVGNLRKPNGEVYRNTDQDHDWLGGAVKAARWLGHVPFERIVDERNGAPAKYRSRRTDGYGVRDLSAGVSWSGDWELDLSFSVTGPIPPLIGFGRDQPYALSIFGEKSSLEDVLDPIAQRRGADLYLGTGEISDTLAYEMARDGAEDGRPLIVFTVADFDPSGHQMAVSVARKLQAQRDLFFPKLRFEIVPLALNAGQVRQFDLPSTPLKDSEQRADKWRAEHGLEQTEIDALATLRPDVLRQIVEEGLAPYFDPALERRVQGAESDWRRRARRTIDQHIDPEALAEIEASVETIEAEARERIEAIRREISARIAGEDDRLQRLAAGVRAAAAARPARGRASGKGPASGTRLNRAVVDRADARVKGLEKLRERQRQR